MNMYQEIPVLKTLYQTKQQFDKLFRCYTGQASSGSGYNKPQMTPQQMIDIYNQYLPSTLGNISGQAQPTAIGLAGAANSANPMYTAGGLSQLENYAPGYQQAGSNLALQQANSTNQLLSGPGAQTAGLATNLSNILNPTQAANQNQAQNLVNSINLNGLSGGEQSAVERSLNQSNYATGNMGLDNATNAVSNAMQFGNALQAKRTALGSALGTASGVAANQNTFVNPVGTALGSGNTANNFGLGTFNPTQANSNLTVPYNAASSFGSMVAQNASAQKGAQSNSSASGGIGGMSCYLTTACCEYMGLPDDCEELTILRVFRDSLPESLVKEYYRIAPAIVSKIKNNVAYLQYIYGVVQSCVKDIKSCNRISALNRYVEMVNKLKD